MGCSPKIKLTCGSKTFAACTVYESDLPSFSELECPTIEETTSELYDLITEIRDGLNFQSLVGECITFPQGTLTALQVLTAMQDFICAQNETITELQTAVTTLQTQVAELLANNCPE